MAEAGLGAPVDREHLAGARSKTNGSPGVDATKNSDHAKTTDCTENPNDTESSDHIKAPGRTDPSAAPGDPDITEHGPAADE